MDNVSCSGRLPPDDIHRRAAPYLKYDDDDDGEDEDEDNDDGEDDDEDNDDETSRRALLVLLLVVVVQLKPHTMDCDSVPTCHQFDPASKRHPFKYLRPPRHACITYRLISTQSALQRQN